MKKLFLFTTILLFAFVNLKSQTINNLPLKDLDVEYLQIVGASKMFSTKVTIQIDLGQRTKFFSSKDEMQLKDENGEKLEFNSMIDALNFMSANGYEFVTAYVITVSNQNVYHYLMRRKK